MQNTELRTQKDAQQTQKSNTNITNSCFSGQKQLTITGIFKQRRKSQKPTHVLCSPIQKQNRQTKTTIFQANNIDQFNKTGHI